MSSAIDECLILLNIVVNVLTMANLTQRGLLMHDWLELFDAQHYSQVVISAEVLGRVSLSQV